MGECSPIALQARRRQAGALFRTSKAGMPRGEAPRPARCRRIFLMRIYRPALAVALWAAPAFAQAPVALGPAAAPPAAAQSSALAGGTLSLCGGAYQIGPPANL